MPDAPPPRTLSPATLLELIWLASPALPVGGFSHSEGLESAVESRRVSDEATARDWLLDQLQLSLGRADLPALAAALRAVAEGDAPRIAELNRWVLATRESAELRLQTEQMGRSLMAWLRQRSGTADP